MHEIRIETLTPWIEILCEAGDARARDRLLLEGVLALRLCEAAAIWRRGNDGAWREHVARGPAERLPRAGDVEAIADRRVAPDVLPGRRVHVHGSVALALGGVDEERDPLDVAGSLLAAYALVDAGSPAEAWPAPLPVRGADKLYTVSSQRSEEDSRSEEARRVHHDLRNVLTSLRATEDLLARFSEGLSQDESERFRMSVERECVRAGELLAQGFFAQGLFGEGSGAQVLDAGRESGPGHGPVSGETLLSSPTSRAVLVVEQVLEAERAAFTVAGIALRVLIEPAARAAICAIPAADLGRIVQNLLVNARQALMKERSHAGTDEVSQRNITPGCVWITLERLGSARNASLVLVVEDDGPGIDPRDLDRVFEPGFSTRNEASSQGIRGRGLAIVRSLAEAAGGSARAEVRALGGARLRVQLPLVRGDEVCTGSDP